MITVGRLIEILEQIEDKSKIVVNEDNILITDVSEDNHTVCIY